MTTAMLVLALAFWGQTPACGVPDTEVADLPAPVIGLAEPATCTITLDPQRPRGAGRDCMTYLHEYGHLLGKQHSSDRDSIMYPVQQAPHWPCAW